MLPIERFKLFVQQSQLFDPSNNILLAVSGGRDSVFLAHLFNAAGYSFGIAHCNFALRGEESDQDEQFTEELANSFNVPFFKIRFDTAAYAKENGISIQMAARELRYQWFEEIRDQAGYHNIALAHHAGDATETVLLNLCRGTGIAGLHGILPKRGTLIRPLLFLTRDEINKFITEQNIPYREDSSNLSSKYARNKIRLEVIPKLKELNEHLDETFEKNSRRFAELEDFLDIQVTELRNRLFKLLPSGATEINTAGLKILKPQHLLLYELFKPFGFNEAVLSDLADQLDGLPGKKFESSTYILWLDRQKLFLNKKSRRQAESLLITAGSKETALGNIILSYTTAEAEKLVISGNKDLAFFDAEKIKFPLELRPWQEGDYFFPFGMRGKKKISDFFTSLRIPLPEKPAIPLLVNGNGDILWVTGYRQDDRYKVTEQTKKVLIFEKRNSNDT